MVYSSISSARQQAFNTLRLDPYGGYNFVVEINGLITGGFSEVSGLDGSIDVEEYAEGGLNSYTHKFPTRATHSNIVLRKGLTDIDSLWGWYSDVVEGKVKRRNGTIMMLDRQGIPASWWTFKNAYPVRWEGPQFNANSTETIVEALELVHEGIDKPLLARVTSAARAAATLGGWTGF